MPKIGVVIRTLNESEFIARCIDTLQGQQPQPELDILVVDSGSTDQTVEIAEAHGARIYRMSPDDFDYSKSLNVGIEEVDGELIVLLSAHAIPLNERWLAGMVAPFEDPEVAGTNCKQVPWPGAPWWEVRRLSGIFGDAKRVFSTHDQDGILFSNAASCIRRSVWREHPFTLPAAEDMDWAQRMVAAGYKIVYDPSIAVYHSHDESPRAQARRMIDINRADTTVVRDRRRVLRDAAGLLYRNARAVIALKEPAKNKAHYLVDLLKMVWFYVADFNAAGTTAERRREDAA
jgi:rhamnosyltransferase